MKLIELTQGKVTQVSDEDYEWLMQWKWHSVKNRVCWHARRTGSRKPIYMHRVIFERIIGRPLEHTEEVDHRDCDGLNNQRKNFRFATRQQQCGNRTRPSTNTSGFKGVCFKKGHRSKPWFAQIEVDGRNNHLGYFTTAREAAGAYDAAARRYFGEFALVNG